MLCFLRLLASVTWRGTSSCSTDCHNEQLTNAVKLRGLSIRKSARVILFSSIFLYGLLPVSLLAGGAPATPGSISASDGAFLDIIRITWADVADETEYQVFRCATIDLATCGDAITTLPADTTQYDDINIFTIGSKNYYRLKSCNSIDCSDFSSADIGYTKLISGNGYEDADVSIRSFTVNGTSQVSLPMPPSGPVILDWSTRSAEYCEASSTPHLDNWNTSVSVSTYGPKSVQLPATANSYSLGLNCHSSPDFELSEYVIVTVGNVPDAPTLNSATADDESVVLAFTPNGDGGAEITAYTAKCGAITQNGNASPITVGGLTNGVEYTCSVFATNVLGNSALSNQKTVTPMTNPQAPTLISATAADSSAVLTFSINDNGGSDITSFTATCGGNNQVGTSSPITVNGLTNGVEVTCSVIATNDVGPSGPSNVKAVTPKTTPDAPTLISATEGDSSAVLTFSANDNGGSAIISYTATCGGNNQLGASSPITVNGLTNGVEVTCSVIATNEVGNSGPSNAKLVTPYALVQPSITRFDITSDKDPQPVSCGDTNIVFDWEAVNTDRCYGSWAESVSNPEGLLYGSIDQQTGALYDTESVLFEDLALTKQFTLRCENNNSETSLNKSLTVEAPCLTTVYKSWDDVFSREWPAPKSYTTSIRIVGDKAWAIKFNTGPVVSKSSTSSPITITGLQRGAQYSCSVIASNAIGQQSASSNLLYFNPIETEPEPPTLVSATAGDRSATLTFTARDDLFAINSYRAKCGAITRYGTSSPITVNNLTNGTGYYCTVTATNDAGESASSNEIPVTPKAPALFVASVNGDGTSSGVSSTTTATTAAVPSAPTLISSEPGHLSTELVFTDNVPAATSYRASCRISTLGGVGTIEYASTRGERLIAVSRLPGDFQVADECKVTQYGLTYFLYAKTEGSDYDGPACELEPNKDYYWNVTFTDGINTGTSSCSGTPCQTYLRTVNPDTVN